MSKVSIFEKKWLDLVFEGKNQEYGAYQLRRESSNTTIKALLLGISFLGGMVLLLSSFTSTNVVNVPKPDGPIIHVNGGYNPPKDNPKKENPKKENPIAKKEVTKEKIEKKDLNHVVLVSKEDKPDEIRTNIEMRENPQTNNTNTDGGTGTTAPQGNGGETGGKSNAIGNIPVENPNEIHYALEEQPKFPGGIDKFRQYVADNVKPQEIDDEEVKMISVTMSFVIEKDGSISDIKVLKSSGYDLDKEAIRVLKGLKTKWTPGKMGGKPVRSAYTLPIKIQMN